MTTGTTHPASFRTPVSAVVRMAADADKLLSWLFDEHLRREAARYGYWHQDYIANGAGGVSRGGELRPFVPKTDAQILEEARAELASRQAFAESPEGHFLSAITGAEGALQEIQGLLNAARSARSRGFPANAEFAGKKMREAEDIASSLLRMLGAGADRAEAIRVAAYEAANA